ncbi:MAG TPA: D-alanyl-D-alanine carboxypeptidase [Chitinophagaceae bacterium]|nr:D-alanyl-D-alanine carboxypeptidase [Chitinophagaceae bacterium]
MNRNKHFVQSFFFLLFIASTFPVLAQKQAAKKYLLNNEKLDHAFIGICLYNTETGEVSYKHNAFKYFTPASNTKLYSFYAGLRYLGDSTTGIQYQVTRDTLFIRGTGDPTVFHDKFENQTVVNFLKQTNLPIALVKTPNDNPVYGPGWMWDDYNGGYQPERTAFPVYGNVVRFYRSGQQLKSVPAYFSSSGLLVRRSDIPAYDFKVKRAWRKNIFYYNFAGADTRREQEVPFITSKQLLVRLLTDALDKEVYSSNAQFPESSWKEIGNIPLDDMFKEMMYESDNFFAEQTDAMVSMKLFGEIDTEKMIDYLLDHDFKIFPNEPKWVDGSGLSRYNLFSPADFVTLLTLMYRSFPHERIYSLLPTGGKGTLKSYYHDMSGSIFAKTGSLSNNVTLSGYLITQKKNTYIFSIMINHTMNSLSVGRHAMEDFLRTVWQKY